MAEIVLAQGPLTYTENSAAIALGSVTLSGFESISNFDGFTLTASLSNGISSDRLGIIPGSGNLGLDGRQILLGSTIIGTFTGGIGSTTPLVISLNSSATLPAVQLLVSSLGYSNVSDALPDGNRTLNLFLFKGGTSASASRAIAVSAADDAPFVLEQLPLYDGDSNQLPTVAGAAPGGPWFYSLDLTKVPDDFPIITIPFPSLTLDFRGKAIQGNASLTAESGGTILTTDNAAYAGLSNYRFNYDGVNLATLSSGTVPIGLEPVSEDFPVLDRNAGYSLSFTADLLSESRTTGADKNGDGTDDRAGFSVIVIGDDLRGIELGFWPDRIWAQNDGTTQVNPALEPDNAPANPFRTFFTQGESTAFDTSGTAVAYEIVVKGDLYTLYANGAPILSGPLRTYKDFKPSNQVIEDTPLGSPIIVVPPNPYEQSNFIFLGDSTPTAQASVKLGDISVNTANGSPAIAFPTGSPPQPPVFQIQDPDAGDGLVLVTLTVAEGTLNLAGDVSGGVSSNDISDNGTGTVQLLGTLEQINQTLAASNGLSYQVSSGAVTADAIAVTVSAPPDPNLPTLSFTNSVTAIAENLNTTSGVKLAEIAIADADGGNNEIALTGADQASFQLVDGSSGKELWLAEGVALDFENRSSYSVTVTVDDANLGSGPEDSKVFTLSVTDIDESLWLKPSRAGGVVKITDEQQLQLASVRPFITDANWQIQAMGSISAVNQTDYVWRNQATGQVVLWENVTLQPGGNPAELSLLAQHAMPVKASALPSVTDRNWTIAGAGNFNGDSRDDLVWYNASAQELVVWYLDGATKSGSVAVNLNDLEAGYQLEGVGDFNGDDLGDFFWRNANGETLIWFMAEGAVRDSTATLETLAVADWSVTGIGDYNQDGKADIAWGQGSVFEAGRLWLIDGSVDGNVLLKDLAISPQPLS